MQGIYVPTRLNQQFNDNSNAMDYDTIIRSSKSHERKGKTMKMYCWKLHKLSLFYCYYMYVDTQPYLADQLFIRNKVPVDFLREFSKKDNEYIFILCRVRKKDEQAFRKSIEQLPDSMMVCGHADYTAFCDKLSETIDIIVRENRKEGRYA